MIARRLPLAAVLALALVATGGATAALAAPRPPAITVTKHAAGTAPGYVFLAPKTPAGAARGSRSQGGMFVNDRGRTRWFHPSPLHQIVADVRVQTYRGKPVLTYWQGHIQFGHGMGRGVILNRHYHVVATVRAGQGCRSDLHEFRLTPQGTALLTCYFPTHRNLRSVGGHRHAPMYDSRFQEVDVRTGKVLFHWSAEHHVPLSDSHLPLPDNGGYWDPYHINSVFKDASGNYLVSLRHTWSVLEIDGRTGRVLWRLGGKRSSFKLGPGAKTAWQHDAEWIAPGLMTIFDNGAAGRQHPHFRSRAITLAVDEQTRTATLVKRLVHPGRRVSANSQGNNELLPDGGTFVGWGATGRFSEFSPTGRLLFDAHVPKGEDTYRAYRYPWTGTPSRPPVLQLGARAAHASWNGSTEVRAWQLLAGPGRHKLHPVGTPVRWRDLRTRIRLHGHGPWLAVRALDGAGAALATSAPVRRLVSGHAATRGR